MARRQAGAACDQAIAPPTAALRRAAPRATGIAARRLT
jgi:hypothetical protein